MVTTEGGGRTAAIWRAAIRDAAPIFSAYLTPLGYSLGSFAVRVVQAGDLNLSAEVGARLDLGRANQVVDLLHDLDGEVTASYRHELVYSQGIVAGKPHVPRYLQLLARGDRRGVPVIVAQRQPTTPENLFVAEVVRVSRLVCSSWMTREESAESALSTRLAEKLSRFEARAPWSILRGHPRPTLSELSATVSGRIAAGIISSSGAVATLHRLFPPREYDRPLSLEESQDALAFLASNDPRFEDKIFELIVLAWILNGLRELADVLDLDLGLLKRAGGRPIARATLGNQRLEVFFQAAAAVLPEGHWKYRNTQQPLRAIPDIVIRYTRDPVTSRLFIVDAKNRTSASESEVTYKLLGYRENLRLSPYFAVGVYPADKAIGRIRRVEEGASQVAVVHIPLVGGARVVRRILRTLA